MHSPTQSPLADATAHIKSAIPAESAVRCIGGVIGGALLLSSVAHPRCPVHARNCTASTMHFVNAPRTARKPGIQKKQGELYRVYKIFCTALSPKSECAEKCRKVMRSAMHLPESNATPLDLFPFSTLAHARALPPRASPRQPIYKHLQIDEHEATWEHA